MDLEASLSASRNEAAALRAELALLRAELVSCTMAATEPVPHAERAAAANTAALRAEVRRFVAAASAAAAPRPSDEEDGDNPWASPQHVAITCPCAASVTTRPLLRGDREGDEALVLDIAAEGCSARFALFGAEGEPMAGAPEAEL